MGSKMADKFIEDFPGSESLKNEGMVDGSQSKDSKVEYLVLVSKTVGGGWP